MFDNSIKFHSPTTVEIKKGAYKNLKKYLKKNDVKKVLIIVDSVLDDLGITQKIMKDSHNKDIDFVVFKDVLPEPPLDNVNKAFQLYNESNCDGVIGLGGGSPMDVAKAVSMLATNSGDFTDFIGIGNVPKKGAPLITIPTTSGTGSEVSIFSIIIVDNSKKSIVDSNISADVALVDPELTKSVPKKIAASTGIDTFCHHLESFLSTNSSPLSDALTKEGLKTVSKYLRKSVGHNDNEKAHLMMSYASTLGGYAMNLTEGAAANHGLAFALGAKFNVGHGLSNAVLLPYVFPVIAKAELEKVRMIGEAMGENITSLSDSEVIKVVTRAIKNLVEDVGCLVPISDFGITENDIDGLVAEAKTQERVLNHSTYQLSTTEIKNIFYEAM